MLHGDRPSTATKKTCRKGAKKMWTKNACETSVAGLGSLCKHFYRTNVNDSQNTNFWVWRFFFFFFFLTDSRSSKSTQDCAWESGCLQHMIQWIPAKRGTIFGFGALEFIFEQLL